MLISSHRHSDADLRAWERRELGDRLYAVTHRRRLRALSRETIRCAAAFLRRGPAYVSCSWGKDSVVLAHILRELDLPLVWMVEAPYENPDCHLVRDAFLARWPCTYHQVVVTPHPRTLNTAAVRRELGLSRYISGVRGDESAQRAIRVARGSTRWSCAALGRWRIADVFAYAEVHRLPIHPAYACSLDGTLDRALIRVDGLRGSGGANIGRSEWERRYYGSELDEIERAAERH